MMSGRDPRLAVVIPKRGVVSESFIGAHIEGLFDDPLVVWGSPRPLFVGGDGGVLSGSSKLVATLIEWGWKTGHQRGQGFVGRRLPTRIYDRQLAGFFRKKRIEVVLAEYGTTAAEVMAACTISRTPLVVHFHGFDVYQEATLERLREPYRRLFGMAARIVVVSEHMGRRLCDLGAPAERIVCNSCGVDVGRFHGAEPEHAPPLFLALGRFVEKKGPLLTLEAFAMLCDEAPDVRLVMLGDGPLHTECMERAENLGIDDKVEFPGSVDHVEVAGWMHRARCFVQHSRRAPDGDSEGTPVAVLEASASGLPVVSTRHGGIVDAVIDGESGFLVEEGDIAAMAERMLRFERDPKLAAAMGRVGRRHMIDAYSAELSLGRLRSVLVEAAEATTPPSR